MILHTIPAGMNRTNCYIVGCEETHQGAVIDPGGDGPRIVREIVQSGLDIQYVLVTHAHFDHIGGIADVLEATTAKLAIHPNERPLLEGGGGAAVFGLRAMAGRHSRLGRGTGRCRPDRGEPALPEQFGAVLPLQVPLRHLDRPCHHPEVA